MNHQFGSHGMLQCIVCSNEFPNYTNLLTHVCPDIHQQPQPQQHEDTYRIEQLQPRDSNLQHNIENHFECDTCGEGFPKKSQMLLHSENCYNTNNNKKGKFGHVRSSSGKKSFICGVCNKEFSKKSYLKVHERIHSGEKPFKCGICSKNFSRKDHLQVHKQIHSRAKQLEG